MKRSATRKNSRIDFYIKPSACVEGYYVHKCERHLLYSGITEGQRKEFGLEKPAGSGGIVAARAGEEWETEVINKFIDKKSLHLKTETKDGKISYLKFDADETMSELKKIEQEVRKDKKSRYLYQGCLLAADAFKKRHFRFDEKLYTGQDEGLNVDLTRTYPDLIRADWDGKEKNVVLSVIDVKLARRMKLAHKVQVALYVRLLEDAIEEYNQKAPAKERIEVRINQIEGFLWNGGQEEEKPFLLSDVDGLIDDYFDDVIPHLVGKLYESVQNRTTDTLKDEVERCVGQRCEWCENSTQCLKEMKESNRMQVIPYLSTYAQEYARAVNAPEDIGGFRDFVSDEDNKKMLSCNRTWDYILSDGTTIDVQSNAFPFDWDTIQKTEYRWKNKRSMTMPCWQDVSVIMTAQKYAGSSRVYALGAYVKEFIRHSETAQEDGSETESAQKWDITEKIFVARDSSDEEYFRIIKEFVEYLYDILNRYDEENEAELDFRKQKTLQGYVMDSYELKNLEEVMYEFLEASTDMELSQKTMSILFWMQGEKLVEAGDEEPDKEAEYPVTVIINELKKLVSLPLPVAYRLPDIIPAMDIGIKKEMYFTKEDYRDYFEIISDVMKSDVIHTVWTENKTGKIDDIKKHIGKRFYAEGNLIIRMQAEGGREGHLVRRISPFFLPGRKEYSRDLLKKWYFEVKLESLLAYHQIRNVRLQGIEAAQENGDAFRMRITDVFRFMMDTYVVLEKDDPDVSFKGEWFSALMADVGDVEALYGFDDYCRSEFFPRKGVPENLSILNFLEYSRSGSILTIKALVKGKHASEEYKGKEVFVVQRYTDINNAKIFAEFEWLDSGNNAELLDPGALYGRIRDDYEDKKDALLSYSHPDGLTFTPSQERAFRHLYENSLTVLQGPPGTGKTDFIARAVITLCRYYHKEENRELRVLVSANSHAAIENVLFMADRKMGQEDDISLYKANRYDTKEQAESCGRVRLVSDNKYQDDTYDVIVEECDGQRPVVLGATGWSCSKLVTCAGMHGNDISFDLVIIDEASQVRVMDALLSLDMGDAGSTRYLIVGDSDQLPAIIQGRYGKDTDTGYLYGSVFDFYNEQIPGKKLMLCENFRMNEILLRYSAKKIYGNEYSSAKPEIARRRLRYRTDSTRMDEITGYILDGFSNSEEDYWPLVFCRISGGNPMSNNNAEVMLVSKLTGAIRDRVDYEPRDDRMLWKGDASKDGVLGIVSPHHVHIERLKDRICHDTGAARGDLYIGTVDKLQGQQREAVIVSYGVTDLESAVTEGEFIFNRNRLNVALTRAKCKSITIFSDILTKPSPEMLDTDDEDLQRGIEFVCGFHDFMKQEEADTETDSRGFDLKTEDGCVVRLEVFRKRMKL